MKISTNYIRKYLDFNLPDIKTLANVVGEQLGALEEEPVDLDNKYKDIIVVKIVQVSKVEGSDHLSLVKIDDHGKTNQQRDSEGLIEVICGANNVQLGGKAIYLPPGAILPCTYGKENLKISSKKILGYLSHGMLASSFELDLNNNHDGILLLDDQVAIGTSLLDYLELNDYILDIENKMFTHRPDCFGLIGVARELSGIFNHKFKSPDWYLNPKINPKIKIDKKYTLKLKIDQKELVPRFSAVVLSNVNIKPSPELIQSYLMRSGIRPINNIVDITNLVMLETGQPMHAYDLDKLKVNHQEVVLEAAKNSSCDLTLDLINGKKIKLDNQDLVILNDQNPVALAGIMGGSQTQIDQNTQNILLEAANFDMYSVRRSGMKHGIMSDSLTRFTKGQNPFQTILALYRAINLIYEQNPDLILSSNIADLNLIPNEIIKNESLSSSLTINYKDINRILGSNYSLESVAKMLTNVEFKVKIKKNELIIKPPFWRTDIQINEDIVEEIGRLGGFGKIPLQEVPRVAKYLPKNKLFSLKDQLRLILKSAGANEILTYSFVSKKLLELANQDTNHAYEISNSISPDLNYYRLSLISSLIAQISKNIRDGFSPFVLYEFAKIYNFNQEDPKQNNETNLLGLIFSSKEKMEGSPFYRSRKYLDYIFKQLHLELPEIIPLEDYPNTQVIQDYLGPYIPKRTGVLVKDQKIIGIIGEFQDDVLNLLKASKYTSGLELFLDKLLELNPYETYEPISKYPLVKQDITFESEKSYHQVSKHCQECFMKVLPEDVKVSIKLASLFKKDDSTKGQNFSFNLEFSSQSRTLTEEIIKNILIKFTKLSGYVLI